jgi:hypothetical protein
MYFEDVMYGIIFLKLNNEKIIQSQHWAPAVIQAYFVLLKSLYRRGHICCSSNLKNYPFPWNVKYLLLSVQI